MRGLSCCMACIVRADPRRSCGLTASPRRRLAPPRRKRLPGPWSDPNLREAGCEADSETATTEAPMTHAARWTMVMVAATLAAAGCGHRLDQVLLPEGRPELRSIGSGSIHPPTAPTPILPAGSGSLPASGSAISSTRSIRSRWTRSTPGGCGPRPHSKYSRSRTPKHRHRDVGPTCSWSGPWTSRA